MLATHLGHYNTATTRTAVRFQFSTHAAAGGNVAPNSAFEAADLRIYRAQDSAAFSATQRSSSNGITMTSPFDSLTGFHDVNIDLTDNTDSGFYAAGSLYSVVLAPDETVDSQTLTGVVLAYFEIGPPPVNVTQLSGDATAADNSEAFFDGTGYAGTNNVIPTVTTVNGLGANVITAAATAADFSTEVNAAILAVLGALNDAAADGAVTTTDTMVAYLKQIINTLEGAPGIPTWPASAAPGNAVSIAEAVRQIYDEVAGLNGGALLDAAGVRTAVGLANADLDTQLGDLPTNSELAAALAAADDAVLAAISALNNLSGAQVQSEVNDALNEAIAELTGDPGATPTLRQALMLLYMAIRNRRDTTADADEIHNSAGSVILEATVSDDGTVFTKSLYQAP